MNLKNRIIKLEICNKNQDTLRYVVCLTGDEPLEEAKVKRGIGHIPDGGLFIIHLVFVKPPRH